MRRRGRARSPVREVTRKPEAERERYASTNRRIGARPTMIVKLERAVAANTVARRASTGLVRKLSTPETAY
eukprot:800766-Pleurochrysis_carterae.AAC.1